MSHGHDDYAVEPIPGLPEKLPDGEHILWQGGPDAWQLAKDVFHVRGIGAYFIALMAWRGIANVSLHHNAFAGVLAALSILPFALVGLGLLVMLARISARTSLYTITNRRVVMRIGMALPTAMNIPFSVIGSANLNLRAGKIGDIALSLTGSDRMAWSNLWPHVRPWRLANPEPMLRALPDAQTVAAILGQAVAEAIPSVTTVQDLAKKAARPAATGPAAAMGKMPVHA